MKLLTEYLERAINLERLAASESDSKVKTELLNQAASAVRSAAVTSVFSTCHGSRIMRERYCTRRRIGRSNSVTKTARKEDLCQVSDRRAILALARLKHHRPVLGNIC
jgi:hypothetical protein